MTAAFLRAFAPTEMDSMNYSTRRIFTEHVYPPIPVRCYDWRATFDSYEPGDLTGYGTTKEAAIADLISMAGDGSYELAEMNMLDNTNQLSRTYSANLDRQHFAAAEREERIAEIRDAVTKAWLEGEPTCGAEPLAQIVADHCYDHPDSPLPGMLLVVAAAARGEDARELANAIINRFALDHAKRVVRQE